MKGKSGDLSQAEILLEHLKLEAQVIKEFFEIGGYIEVMQEQSI